MGKFDTHGGVFAPQGFMKIEAGGTHEENPNGGVQVGVDPNGVPNMLEENEPVYQDFVYSDSIVADGNILKEFNLPEKFGGKKYSEIVDQYVDEERPNDAIANNGMNAMLVRLANAQEEQKKRTEMKELEDELSKLTPEQLEELEAALSQQENPDVVEQPAEEATIFDNGGDMERMKAWLSENVDVSDATKEILLEQLTGENRSMSNSDLRLRFREIVPTLLFGENNIGKYMNKFQEWGIPFDDAWELAHMYNADMQNPYRKRYYDNMREEFEKNYSVSAENNKNYDEEVTLPDVDVIADKINHGGEKTASASEVAAKKSSVSSGASEKVDFNKFLQTPVRGINYPNSDVNVPSLLSAPELTAIPYDGPAYEGLSDSEFNRSANEYANKKAAEASGRTTSEALLTFPRYAGAITSGLMGLYNAFQEPDKYKIPRVIPVLSNTRLQTIDPVYRPVDANMAVNDVLASGAGTTRALRNSGLGPSQAAALLAADYNIGRNIGNARTQVADYNNNLYSNIIAQTNANRQAQAQVDLNRERNNTMLLYDAAIRNAQNNLMQQRYNYDAEGQKYTALSNQIDQVAQALANIGYENFAMNQANSSGLDYRTGRNGTTYYVGGKRCGGLLKKYKR